MLKKRVLTLSLSLLVCLCCCFSGFGSVKVFAYQAEYHLYPVIRDTYFGDSISQIVNQVAKMSHSSDNIYTWEFSNTSSADYECVYFGSAVHNFTYPYDPALNDYYYIGTFSANDPTATANKFNIDFSVSDIRFIEYDGSGNTTWYEPEYTLYRTTNDNSVIYSFIFPFTEFYDFSVFRFDFNPTLNYSNRADCKLTFEGAVLSVPKDSTEEYVQSIIAAINDQTNTLNGSIDQAADDLQQSIEDQYQMEDEEDFGFSDIQQQYEEKMGVLTFGTETTLQMLDLFSPSNAGEAVIRVPAFTMDIQGTTYQIWDEYVFRFSWIEDWIPFLIKTMRTFNVVMFYLAILQYVNKVYERNFLAK